jgi:AraC family transcriptional regulator
MWQRRATLIHFYLAPAMLWKVRRDVLIKDSYELLSMYLVRESLIEELAREVFSEFETGVLNDKLAQAVITVLSAHVLRVYCAQPEDSTYFAGGLGPARERRVREFIERGIDGDLSVKTLAQSVGLSVQHFAALFCASTGFTPHQYMNHRRVEHAQRLLTDRKLPLVEVAHRCGFSSQSQFITLFRRFVGVTPGRYRSSIVPTMPSSSEAS